MPKLVKKPITVALLPVKPTSRQIEVPQASAWELATGSQQSYATDRCYLVEPVLDKMAEGVKLNTAVSWFISKLKIGEFKVLLPLATSCGRSGKLVSESTIKRWIKAHQKHGKEGLLPNFTGRVRKTYGWEQDAIVMYNIPSKPAMGDVAFRLRNMGFDEATDSRVRRYLNAMPARLGKESAMRVGKHYYGLNKTPHKMRDKSVLMVGELYQGDGHCVDVYVAHPATGKPYRPELTAYIDIRSRYITGWYLSESESAISTLYSLSHAMISQDHVPAWVHIDNGSGFKAKMLNDESIGFYSRFSISTTFQIPGNPRGKGEIEGWFGIFRNKHDKFWNNGKDYCGHDQAGEINRRLTEQIKQGKRKLLSLSQYRDSVAKFIKEYNDEPSKALDGKSPAQLWSGLTPVPVEIEAEAVVRPRVSRTVRKYRVTLHNRTYQSNALVDYDGATVSVEYDLHNDSVVKLYDVNNRYICMAELVAKIAYLPESRLEEARDKRLKGQQKRLQVKLKEAENRRYNPLDMQVSEAIEHQTHLLEAEINESSEIQQSISQETASERYQRWQTWSKKENLSEEQQDFVELYPQSPEFKTQLELHGERL